MLNLVRKEFVVFAGLLAAPAVTGIAEQPPVTEAPQQDPRLVRLQAFFAEHKCPVDRLAADFLLAADRNDLDWRLLPSISLLESGGGRDQRNNNIFGWDSGKQSFPSVRAGIHIVAFRLSNSRLYRDKDLDEILNTYNPNPEYAGKVKAVMQAIGSADLSAARTSVN